MLYDEDQNWYSKKDSLILLNLISKSKPDQVKLVGRIHLDLAEVINLNTYAEQKSYPLQFCSVDSNIAFTAKLIQGKASDKDIALIDKSEFGELNTSKFVKEDNRSDNSFRSSQFGDKNAKSTLEQTLERVRRDSKQIESKNEKKPPYSMI